MTKRHSALLTGAAAFALLVPAATGAPIQLQGTVGPYRTIQLRTAEGANAARLKAGMFTFRIQDRASEHNFALKGPGVNRALTGVRYTGTRSVTLRLRKGVYTFYCSPHSRSMRGTVRAI